MDNSEIHIFIVTDGSDSKGGVSVYVEKLYEALAKEGVSSSLVTYKNSINTRIIRDMLVLKSIVIHVNGLWTPFLHKMTRLAISESVPILLTTHGMLDPWALSHKYLKKKIAWYAYQKNDISSVDIIHTTSLVESNNVRDIGIKIPLVMIPNAVNMHSKNRIFNYRETKVVLFLSRIHPVKGLLDLINAWNSIDTKGWRLIIAGEGEKKYTQLIKNKVNAYHLESEISFIGHVSRKEKELLYLEADLFILPTHSENFGLAIAEAMSYGLPVITTKSAPWSIIEKDNCGWWVDVGVESLSKALTQSFNIPITDLQRKGENARKVIANNYTWPVVISKIVNVYKQLASKSI
jgi:glycosyltransferase involved in cell wall biosynthesis